MLKMLTAAVLLAGASSAAAEPSSAASAELQKATAAYDKQDCPTVLASVTRLKKMPDYQQDDFVRRVTLEFSALCLAEAGDKDAAYADALRATGSRIVCRTRAKARLMR